MSSATHRGIKRETGRVSAGVAFLSGVGALFVACQAVDDGKASAAPAAPSALASELADAAGYGAAGQPHLTDQELDRVLDALERELMHEVARERLAP
jgi:hypothetical protein